MRIRRLLSPRREPLNCQDAPNRRPPDIVRDLIAVADGLVDLTDDEAIADPAAAAAFARWITQRIGIMIIHCEVSWIADEGPFDPARHEAVASRPAPDAEQAGRIAETVRPGYLWRDQIVRPQQVIVYAAAVPLTRA